MAKTQTTYFCQNCGNQSSKWLGKCPACGEWNTYQEEVVSRKDDKKGGYQKPEKSARPVAVQNISSKKENRLDTQSEELFV